MGKQLEKINRATGKRVPIQIAEGMRRPVKAEQSSRLASESGIQIRNHVPVLTHWKEYKDNNVHLDNFMGKLAVKLAIDKNDKATKDVCTDLLKGGIRQNRYVLKKRYFDGVPANEVRTTSPVSNMTDGQWQALVQKWSDPKSKEISEKNKQNRAKVQFHQATGSRSYIAHCHSIKEKAQVSELDALNMFKACHYSKKKEAYSEPVQRAIVEMEGMLQPD